MAEFKISRFRYTWKGPWQNGTAYIKDDVVSYRGSSFVCVRAHTATSFNEDQNYRPSELEAIQPGWVKMTQGFSFRGTWTSSTVYEANDTVIYGGVIYKSLENQFSSATFDIDSAKWDSYIESVNFRENWADTTRYYVNDVVRYGGIVYLCITEHTSTTTLRADIANWQVYYENIEFKGTYAADTAYKKNDLVVYKGAVLRSQTSFTSGEAFSYTNWDLELPGYVSDGEWDPETYYGIGSVVRLGGYLYYAVEANINQDPNVEIYQGSAYGPWWKKLNEGYNYRGAYVIDTAYRAGDVVRRGGNLWIALVDTDEDGSTLNYLDTSNWKVLTTSNEWRGNWAEGERYALNDVILFNGSSWICTEEHDSDNQNYPGDAGSDFDYWDLLVETATSVGMRLPGDLLSYDLSRKSLTIDDDSTFGPSRVPIGNEGELLTINNENSLFYKRFGEINRVVYVDKDGIDDINDSQRGHSPFKPWKTIRFAAEQMDDSFSGTTTIEVGPGVYTEILPIIIPARTVILGAELRTTTIEPNDAITALANDYSYTIAVLNRISTLVEGIVTNEDVEKTEGNQEVQVKDLIRLAPSGGILEDLIPVPRIGSIASAESVQDLITDIVNYIDYNLGSGETNPTVSGSNTAVTDQGYLDAIEYLEANKEFLAAEAVAFMISTYPSYNFDSELCKRDVRRYIDAFKYDILYTGNYKSLLAGRYYKNAVNGSRTDDMFYCRDATGVRNCTLRGLQGSLNPPNVFDLYQRPTGGSFISLDPGWGPNDERCWIVNRSPYIQGVTTFGTNCTGQKIDGALHNGGNKSIVSNDFTQVISGGIGAWVRNNGRAELVSVFTYYAQIGYFAENGGIIRGTNGNCSYGDYGAIADGVDATETPVSATVNNRNNEAQIAATFAGEFNDQIFLLEYSNAGQNYTTASATFIGAGAGAQVIFEDFRDDAVFEARLLDTSTDPIAQNIGGSGFSIKINNAQTHLTPGGDATGITLASTEDSEEASILGKRIILTGGTGTGQYGYITGYNNTTKVATVSKESNDQPGWDHVVPGYPIVSALNSTTVYRIEPRVVFSAPEFTATEHVSSITTYWSDIVYGETYESYTDITGEFGTGETDGILAQAAKWDVEKVGRSYRVTLNTNGAGYQVGDTITIGGDELGGITPENDCIITITDVSDDSTNSIIDFESEGTGASGRFVCVSTQGVATAYSSDGETWENGSLPSLGDWVAVTAVRETGESLLNSNVRFVAIRKNSSIAASSVDGINWIQRSLPFSRSWSAVTYGEGKFVAVAEDGNSAAYSTNGITWTATTMPNVGDSSFSVWIDITYGKGKFVAISNTENIAAISEDGITWEGRFMDIIEDSSPQDWVSVTFGKDRWIAASSQGNIAYSFDGEVWYGGSLPTQDGSTAHNWKRLRYGQGLFFAVGDTGGRDVAADITVGPTTFAATSDDGVNWTGRELFTEDQWNCIAFGNPYISQLDSSTGKNTPMWITGAYDSNKFNKIRTGARAYGRVTVSAGVIGQIRLWDPGSGYIDPPEFTIIDPINSSDPAVNCRMADGVLSQPSWVSKGIGYRTATTRVTITGDGFADIIPTGKFITINNLPNYPGPGAQVLFAGNSQIYTLVAITELGEINGGLSATFRISPDIKNKDNLEHGTVTSIRQRYSQVRITGHDFLDIGTGNFEETNYPELYATGLYTPAPENEVYEEDGGRVFYTSTDQSGNFRCGELFAVEQATGVVTISSDFFDFSGLTELRLGGVRLGGTGVVVREFSTDPLFTEDSNNIVPTQRAIRTFLANRLSVGGSEIAVGAFSAGTVRVGTLNELATISSTINGTIIFPNQVIFEGADSAIRGSILAQQMFTRSFKY